MATAKQVLTDLAKDEPEKLPRFEHPLSGEVFARLISDETLAELGNKDADLKLRFPAGLAYNEAVKEIYKRYVFVCLAQKALTVEYVELRGCPGILIPWNPIVRKGLHPSLFIE